MLGLAASQRGRGRDRRRHRRRARRRRRVLPYLAVPVTVTALRRRFREGARAARRRRRHPAGRRRAHQVDGGRQLGQPGYLAVCAQWLILAALGLYAAGTLHRVIAVRGEGKPQPYAEATRLLTQLRTVARQLPGATLDPGGISEHLLEELRTVARADRARGAVGQRRRPARGARPGRRGPGGLGDDAGRGLGDRRRLGQPAAADGSPLAGPLAPRRRRSALVVPLVAGVRTVGLVVLEAGRGAARTRRRWCPG